ncbi:MAG: hypothetical protein GWN01_03040 [Nitrosopumilaceae archaeon]|nr:hypothetical protein [Nitrosopumilaceae archaeon]NIT99941.1 hypothetical protein [Nitrosopumilaceae archaeon]NIU86295.1 hypothetical protein [Nitrosopumilaceae archaeon]NIV65050.1 hypothetical protein [Nitrosopumilaceae archaeon]NIX60544.1 hypothetical protein [Nitrosopumilaceae archaeon]
MADSSVSGIIKALSDLENDLDNLNTKVADMKKQVSKKTQSEIDNLVEKTRVMATEEAEKVINSSKDKAKKESEKINQDSEAKLAEIQNKIDSNFDEAIEHVVSTVLKV